MEQTLDCCIHLLERFLSCMGPHMTVQGVLAREPLSTERALLFRLLLRLLVCMHTLHVMSNSAQKREGLATYFTRIGLLQMLHILMRVASAFGPIKRAFSNKGRPEGEEAILTEMTNHKSCNGM